MAAPPPPAPIDLRLSRAMASATEATRLDAAGQHPQSYTYYLQAVTELEHAMKLATTEKAKAAVRAKLLPYLERTEELLRTVPELADRRKKWEEALRAQS